MSLQRLMPLMKWNHVFCLQKQMNVNGFITTRLLKNSNNADRQVQFSSLYIMVQWYVTSEKTRSLIRSLVYSSGSHAPCLPFLSDDVVHWRSCSDAFKNHFIFKNMQDSIPILEARQHLWNWSSDDIQSIQTIMILTAAVLHQVFWNTWVRELCWAVY